MKAIPATPAGAGRPGGSARRKAGLALAAVLSVLSVLAAERAPSAAGRLYREKVRAAEYMRQGMEAVLQAKRERGLALDPQADPNRTGMIGERYSALTTTLGPLEVKRTTTNPNFAAAIVEMLAEAGVRPGDLVAAGFSGSFPALSVGVLAAARAMGVELLVISSVSASTWGANQPGMTWPDMEAALAKQGLFAVRSLAAAPGGSPGALDNSLFPGGERLALEAIRRSGVPVLLEGDYRRSVERRMELYLSRAAGRPIRVFVNVGGAMDNLGRCESAWEAAAGLVRRLPPCPEAEQGVAYRLADRGARVINLLNIREICSRYGLPLDPVPLPAVGEGGIYRARRFPFLPIGLLLALCAALLAIARWSGRAR